MSGKYDTEQAFLEHIKVRLDHSTETLDEVTLMRLRRIRQQAVQTGINDKPVAEVTSLRERWMMPAAGIAATVMITVMAFTMSHRTPLGEEEFLSAADDMQILATEPAPEFYQDLDFYLWLDEQKDIG